MPNYYNIYNELCLTRYFDNCKGVGNAELA